MDETPTTDVPAALKRVLEAQKETLRSRNHWGTALAGLPQMTALDAFKENKNPTAKTLSALARAANMTLSEMLEYGDPDWEWKVAARKIMKGMSKEEVVALGVLLANKTKYASYKTDDDASSTT